MKIKFNSKEEVPLNKRIKIPSMIIVVRAVFHENNKCYPQHFLDECLYKSLMRNQKQLQQTLIKNAICKTKNLYILFAYLLLTAVSMYCYVIKYIKKEFNNEPVCNKEFLKTKIRSHADEITGF